MSEVSHRAGVVGVVPEQERAAALALVFDWEPESLRSDRVVQCLRQSDLQGDTFRHLLEVRRDHRRVAAAWGQVSPGRVINVWPASLVQGEPARTRDLLQQHLDRCLDGEDATCAQSLLPIQARVQAACLLRHGYSLAAQLLFLVCDPRQTMGEQVGGHVTFEPFRPDQQARLSRLIEATYVGTHDVPALNGLRSTSDVIDGYRHTGTFTPELWLFVRDDERDVGCLLLSDHPQTNQYELVYMGLIPSARGRGWGERLTRHAQALAPSADRQALLLGVDAANYPAIVTYARCGFSEVDRRIVFCRPSPSVGGLK